MSDLAIAECPDLSLAMVLVRRGARTAAEHAMRDRVGLHLPAPGRLTASGATTLLWHGPDRFLALREGARPSLAGELAAALDEAAFVADATASRLVVTVAGRRAIEALNTLLPIDLHPRVFTPGSMALTRAAHIDVTVWRAGDDATFGLACAASYAASFRHYLASL